MRSVCSSVLIAAGISLLAGCKADELEISVDADQIRSAIAGEVVMVNFEATFSTFGDLDEQQRADVAAMEALLGDYMEIEDFELSTTETGFEVAIDGLIEMTSGKAVDSAYFLSVQPSTLALGQYQIQFSTGGEFETFSRAVSGINFMLAPDAYHPTVFRLSGSNMELWAPAVEVDGQHYLMWQGNLDGRLRLVFRGGAFDETGAGFFINSLE